MPRPTRTSPQATIRELAETASVREAILLQSARRAKGGVIGIGPGKAAVALRFDDGHDVFNATVYPLLTARGLPFGFASISDLTSQPWSRGTTPATVKSWTTRGGEIWSHGIDHLDPTPGGDQRLYDQIVGSKATIESWGVKCQGWMQPGATPTTVSEPYGYSTADANGIRDISDLWTTAGRLIRATYPLSESYNGGQFRSLPHGMFHGQDHITVSDGMTLATAQSKVDRAIQGGLGVEFMCHSANLGGAGRMTVADFTSFLDYIVTKWDAGLIDVVTPSGLFFTDKSTQRLDLVQDGGFELSSTGTPTYWIGLDTLAGVTVETSGGHSGSNFLRIPSTQGGLTVQRPSNLQDLGMGGETFLFRGWARAKPGDATGFTRPRVIIQDYEDTSRLNLNLVSPASTIGTTWKQIRYPFTTAPQTNRIAFSIGRNSGDGVDWDDVSIVKV